MIELWKMKGKVDSVLPVNDMESKEENEKLYDVYAIRNDKDELNKLGLIGWEVISQSPFLLAKPFKMEENSKILDQFEAWINIQANKDTKVFNVLKKWGFSFKKVYNDEKGKAEYRVERKNSLTEWRLEIEVELGEDQLLVGMTFGPLEMNTPIFYGKDAIDKYVPREILDEMMGENGITPTKVAK